MMETRRNISILLGAKKSFRSGFALVSVLVVASMTLVVALGLLAMSGSAIRQVTVMSHQSIARENARLALIIAIGELQNHAGQDQRATAAAAVLESPGEFLPNRNWVGVWKTTHAHGSREWPVIGKGPSIESDGSPYGLAGVYVDLRHTQEMLDDDKWKDEMHLTWLVSRRNESIDVGDALDPADANVVELVGRGTLGDDMNEMEFLKNRILVEKVDIGGSGRYGWYVADESLKASIAVEKDPRDDIFVFEAAVHSNPALIKVGEDQPFRNFNAALEPHFGKLITYGSIVLALDETAGREYLRQHWNHFTVDSGGLFTNPVTGGLKRDLTPLLLGRKDDASLELNLNVGGEERFFSSRLPIIPGQEHGVLGPSFDAMRSWALHAHSDLNDAETVVSSSALRIRPAHNWAYGIADGAVVDASRWATDAPKIHPVMTDVRWHYYFSIHNRRIRTHIIPRVCLWNPYSREIAITGLSVLMPNPFHGISHGIHFFPEESHVDELKEVYKADSNHRFTRWSKTGGYAGGPVYKLRTNPFPTERYLAFTLEGTLLGPGECHVFSPRITTPDESALGIHVQAYRQGEPSFNVLSSSSLQGGDHFYYDHDPAIGYQIQASSWLSLSPSQIDELDFERIFDYQPEMSMQHPGDVDGFPFILKSGTSDILGDLYKSVNHPTLQLIYFGAGGSHSTKTFAYQGIRWGSANQQYPSFGNLERFRDAPLKEAPSTHQVGAKLLWLNERETEGNAAPLRVNRWTSDHMALNVAPIANWNVRAQLAMRSPASQVANKYYMTGAGVWYLQFVPYPPQNMNDLPGLNPSGSFVKNPFGASVDHPFSSNVVLFDLPTRGHGLLSLARLRHAMLSPYSWSPTYIVGHSLRDLHAPSDKSAHELAVTPYGGVGFPTRWDFLIGAAEGISVHGGFATAADSQGVLQTGVHAVSKYAAGRHFTSESEVLAYDIAHEVNTNLWDGYFISTLPLAADTTSIDWDADEVLTNLRYQLNDDGGLTKDDIRAIIGSVSGLEAGFYRSAEFLRNSAAFNVNSTSVPAWIALLSSTLGKKRVASADEMNGDHVSFSRHLSAQSAADTAEADPGSWGAWVGMRRLSDDEVRTLAKCIVLEVKRRGPFLSLADFVNRRLSDAKDETSHQGALDAAIMAAGLNANFMIDEKFLTTSVNHRSDAPDNNHPEFVKGYRYLDAAGQYTTTQPRSKAWGMPGYLTQGDLLEPLAPALVTRGDTFVIRGYGESSDATGVKARAWVEGKVVRTPHYLEHRDANDVGMNGNVPMDAAYEVDFGTGQIAEGNLSEINKRFGRKFKLKSFRWLHPDEV